MVKPLPVCLWPVSERPTPKKPFPKILRSQSPL